VGYSFVSITGGVIRSPVQQEPMHSTLQNALGIMELQSFAGYNVRTRCKQLRHPSRRPVFGCMMGQADESCLTEYRWKQEQLLNNCVPNQQKRCCLFRLPVPFRLVASACQITQGNQRQNIPDCKSSPRNFIDAGRISRWACAWRVHGSGSDHFLLKKERLIIERQFWQWDFHRF